MIGGEDQVGEGDQREEEGRREEEDQTVGGVKENDRIGPLLMIVLTTRVDKTTTNTEQKARQK